MDTSHITITEISDVLYVSSPKGRRAQINNRNSYGLSFCREGKITYTHNGKDYVSDNKHIILLPQGQSYTLRRDKTGRFTLINFTCTEHLTDTFFLFPVQNLLPFFRDFEQMQELFLFAENRAKLMSIFYGMLHNLATGSAVSKSIAPAMDYIEKNYADPELTNQKLADICNISEVYLRKLFDKHLKTSPHQYICDIRLQKAKQLLTEGHLKIQAVCTACGFTNPYHFSRFFKQHTGLTPTDYVLRNKSTKL